MKKIFKMFSVKDAFYALFAVVFIVLQVWLDLTMPDYTAGLTEAVSGGNLTMSVILKNGGMMLLCAAGSLLCSIICGYFVATIAASFSKNARQSLFDKITSFSAKEMNEFSTSSLITRTTNDVEQLHRFIAMGLQMLIKAPVLAIWAISKISASSIEWTTATIICVAVIVVTVGTIVALCLPRFKKVQKLTDNLNTATRENLSGVRVVRAFNAEEYQEQKFEKANDELTENQLFTSKATGLLMPVLTLCMNGLTLAIYWIGATLVNNAALSEKAVIIGNMAAFTQYALQVVMAFMMLIMMFIMLPRVIVSGKRISEVLNTEPSIKDGEAQLTDGENKNVPSVEFRNVSFSYSGLVSENVLENINLTVNKGETLAIVGATGSGKTTMIDLLTRVYDVTSGEILVDGVNVKDYKESDLQEKIAVTSQKAALFKGDIAFNVSYGSKVKDDENVKAALKVAEAEFIFGEGVGIHAPVAQGGTNFSGGQKQRISIARTIYKNSPIMVFDDSFSALDYKTDSLVRKNIKENFSDRTVIIVAQRIGTVMNADKIAVIDDGRIAGFGKHEELLKSCPVYKSIALSQLNKEELGL
ncbi:MAG TPA: multidrug ABC transporter ATP-binding protein [Clostridiales bacterium]|nr:multidrug ABC transporter ATP-binding protein [Clostridiales bacterium]